MDHAARVRVVQRLGALEHDLDGVVDAQQVVRTAVSRQRAGALHVLGDDIAVAVFLAGIVDGQDVRMLQHSDQVCFGEKHLARNARALLVAAGVHVVDLDGDVAAVVRVMRQVDDTGAAAAHLSDDHVLADLVRHAALGPGGWNGFWSRCRHGRGAGCEKACQDTVSPRHATVMQASRAPARLAPGGGGVVRGAQGRGGPLEGKCW